MRLHVLFEVILRAQLEVVDAVQLYAAAAVHVEADVLEVGVVKRVEIFIIRINAKNEVHAIIELAQADIELAHLVRLEENVPADVLVFFFVEDYDEAAD